MDVNECATWGACSQLCVNTVGGHKCDCAPGYVMINNSCMVTGHSFHLSFFLKGLAHESDLAFDDMYG
jgi:low-density lipoprotein receptor-related protein 1 (alpha-2-macroglobulin receptor)